MNCARVTDTITREIGYCNGVLKYTTDGGLMDQKPDGSREIISFVAAMIGLLYDTCAGYRYRRPTASEAARPGRYYELQSG